MIIKDFHVHESHSPDARRMSKDHASVKDYIRAAEEKGVDEVGFATHFIVSGPFINGASRLKRYLSTLGRLRQHRTPPVSS